MAWTIWYPNRYIWFFHLHWTTRQSTVWANGTQNSGLINFIPESILPFLQISSNYWKVTTKAWTWYQRWFLTNGTWICTWNIPFAPRKFAQDWAKKSCYNYFRTVFSRKFWQTVNNQYPTFQTDETWQSTPDDSHLQGKLKKVRVIGSSKKIAGRKEKNQFLLHSEHFNHN